MPDTSNVEQRVRVIHELLENHALTHDDGLLSHSAALDAARWLRPFTVFRPVDGAWPPLLIDPDITLLLARFHYARSRASADDEQRVELDRAMAGFRVISALNPDLVPEPLRERVSAEPLDTAFAVADQVEQLSAHWQTTGDREALNRAIHLSTWLSAALPRSHTGMTIVMANLCFFLRLRFVQDSDPADLDAAIRMGDQALGSTAEDHHWRPVLLTNLGPAYLLRFLTAETQSDLDMAVELSREAVRTMAADHPQHSMCLFNYGHALASRSLLTGDRNDLDLGIRRLREALGSAPAGRPAQRAMFLNALATALGNRYLLLGDPVDLDAAVVEIEHALHAGAADGPQLTAYLSTLVKLRTQQFHRTRTAADIDAAVDAARRALAATPGHHFTRVSLRAQLGDALRARGAHTEDPGDLAEAAELLREAVGATDPGDREYPARLSGLGAVRLTRARISGEPADYDAAVAVSRQAVDACSATDHRRTDLLAGLGRALTARATAIDSREDIDAAIEVLETAHGAIDPESPDAVDHLSGLSEALRRRYGMTRAGTDLDRAAEYAHRAVDLAGTDGADVAGPGNLALVLLLRHQRTGEPADLLAAIDWGRQALRAAPEGHPERGGVELDLGRALKARFDRLGSLADLDEAVRHLEGAERRAPRNRPTEQALRTSVLSDVLSARYDRLGDPGDGDRAVELARTAVRLMPDGHHHRAAHLMALSTVLIVRFTKTGAVADIEAAVTAGRDALAAAGPDHPDRSSLVRNLAHALRSRYEHSGAQSDLDESLELLRRGDVTLPAGHAGQATQLTNLAVTLLNRFRRSARPEDLAAAVAAAREAVAGTTADDPARPLCLSNLAAILHRRFRTDRDPGDAEAAVTAAREAVDLLPGDHANRANHLSNLSLALLDRFACSRRRTHLDEAIEVGRRAAEAAPAGLPLHARCQANLGGALAERHHLTSDPVDGAAALAALRTAARTTSAPAASRVRSARSWAMYAAMNRDWRQAMQGFTTALELLPLLAWHGLDHSDKVDALSRVSGLACDAAAVAVLAGQPETAVRLLELGRGVLFGQAIDGRGDLSELERLAPPIAERMKRIRSQLDRPEPLPTNDDPAAQVRSGEHHRRLASEWDELLGRARALPGLSDLLRLPALDRLRPPPGHGPVVIVNASRIRCDALIVTAETVRTVRLRRLDASELTEKARDLLDALGNARGSIAASWKAQRRLTAVLSWLWDAVAAPVLDKLPRDRGSDGLRRLWWCPTGVLSLLPLHAAGHYDGSTDRKGRPRNLPDRAVCSYAPTLRALAAARDRASGSTAAASGSTSTMLAVGQPKTPGLAELPQADTEIRRLSELVPEATVLTGEHATRDAVLAALPAHGWLHFAGHGGQDPADAHSGALFCHDHHDGGPLTVADIASLRLDHAQLAFLSACETARGVLDLPDEAVHIAGTLQLAGFTHVVATQWVVTDRHAPDIAEDFYTRLRGAVPAPPPAAPVPGSSTARPSSPDSAAACLHAAVRRLREARSPALLWASYIHTGP